MAASGKPLDRVDGRLKVTGAATYAAEWELPGLVHAALIQAGVGAGRITGIDDSRAKAQVGVLSVLTYQNSPPLRVTNPQGEASFAQALFGGPDILYNGQYVGVVVADTLERARHAANLVRFEYAPQQPRIGLANFEAEAFTLPDAPPVGRGSLARGRRSATHTVRATYEVASEHHNPLEPHATIASWQNDQLTVYDSSQAVQASREALAKTFGISPANVRVICPFVGGAFGCKIVWLHAATAALAARTVGRPVKLVMRRQEMFNGHGHRANTRQKMELGARPDGTLTLLRHESINETSMHEEWREDTGQMTGLLYACANVETSQQLVRLHKMVPTYMRGPGEGLGSVALECAVDELAEKLGLDPVEFRLKNDTMVDGSVQKPFSSRAFKECLTRGREAFGWAERPATPGTRREGNFLIGYGVASAVYPATYWPSSARLALLANGQVLVQSSSHDLGTGAYTIFTQVAADVLGVAVGQVRVELGDTRLAQGTTAAGSTTTASTGAAILDAGTKLKAQLVTLILGNTKKDNPLAGLTAAEVTAEAGRVFSLAEPAHGVSYADVLRLTNQARVEALGNNGQPRREDRSYWAFGANFVKVRVDVELGQVRVEKVLGAYGAGRILNPKTARSQMLGSMMWGIGMALHEHTEYDPNNGRVVTRNLADYHIPCCADTPDVEVLFVPETDTDASPLGVKGIGELGVVGLAAAIANAVYNATGKRVRDFPITPDKLV